MAIHKKKVVLFGKTGAGKSTTANVLLTGDLFPMKFVYSDRTQGCTQEPSTISEGDWTILDMVGMGARRSKTKTEERPEDRLKAYLKEVNSDFSHIIYVVKGDRLTTINEMVWFLFKEIFQGGEEAFVILFTGVYDKWLENERQFLPKEMQAVENMCAVRIDPFPDDEELELLYQKKRRKAIEKLRKQLDGFFAARDYRYVQPDILKMDSEALTIRSKSIVLQVKEKVAIMFTGENLQKIIRVLCTVIDIIAAILSYR